DADGRPLGRRHPSCAVRPALARMGNSAVSGDGRPVARVPRIALPALFRSFLKSPACVPHYCCFWIDADHIGDDPPGSHGGHAVNLVVVGCDFRSAPVAVRERLAFGDTKMDRALDELIARYDCEAVIVSTCNRVELYAARPNAELPLTADL